jgi:raffinose/stachyose/melibiose transport system permease protein
MSHSLERAFTHGLLIVFSLIAVYPLVSVLFLAVSRQTDLVTGFTIPTSPSLDSFETAWNRGGFDQALVNSLIVATTVTVATVVLSVLSGYALGTMRFPGSTLVFVILMTGLIIPWESLIIPLYRIFRDWGLTESLWALILPQVGVSVCLGTFWMRSFFRTTPRAIVDAARVDGAGHLRTLVSILTPSATPAILTLSVLVFMYTWNDFLLALVMNPSGDFLTAPLALSFFAGAQRTSDQTVVAAAAVLVALPVVAAYVLLQRQFIRGFLTGAVRE